MGAWLPIKKIYKTRHSFMKNIISHMRRILYHDEKIYEYYIMIVIFKDKLTNGRIISFIIPYYLFFSFIGRKISLITSHI